MKESEFTPGSIINIGLSSAPEIVIWRKRLPGVPVVGIDPKKPRQSAGFTYLEGAATDCRSETIIYCAKCNSSAFCRHVEDRQHTRRYWRETPAIRLDDISSELIPPPHFIWMDAECSELSALRGARRCLTNTGYVCTELNDWVPNYPTYLTWFLVSRAFELVHTFKNDTLFRRVLPIGNQDYGSALVILARQLGYPVAGRNIPLSPEYFAQQLQRHIFFGDEGDLPINHLYA